MQSSGTALRKRQFMLSIWCVINMLSAAGGIIMAGWIKYLKPVIDRIWPVKQVRFDMVSLKEN
jgi:hypothetical protein